MLPADDMTPPTFLGTLTRPGSLQPPLHAYAGVQNATFSSQAGSLKGFHGDYPSLVQARASSCPVEPVEDGLLPDQYPSAQPDTGNTRATKLQATVFIISCWAWRKAFKFGNILNMRRSRSNRNILRLHHHCYHPIEDNRFEFMVIVGRTCIPIELEFAN